MFANELYSCPDPSNSLYDALNSWPISVVLGALCVWEEALRGGKQNT